MSIQTKPSEADKVFRSNLIKRKPKQRAPSVAQIEEFDETYSELKGGPLPGRKLSKAPSIAQIEEFDEDY